MKVFISWSGNRSQSVAHALRSWLPDVLQTVEPFLSAADIEAGQRWSQQLAEQLGQTSFGLVCVTADNQEAAWLNFEAGALAKALGASTVVPLLDDLKPTDLTGPLSQFQAKTLDRDGLTDVVTAINAAMDAPLSDDRLTRAIARSWPDLETRIQHLRTSLPSHGTRRTERDLLEEILTRVRDLGHIPSASMSRKAGSAKAYRELLDVLRREYPEATIRLVGGDVDVKFSSPIPSEVAERVHALASKFDLPVRVSSVLFK